MSTSRWPPTRSRFSPTPFALRRFDEAWILVISLSSPSVAPGRFIPLALLPLWDVSLAVAEVERLVHSLEHGAVWITYQPDLPAAQIDVLRQLARSDEYLIVSPYPGLPAPVVVSGKITAGGTIYIVNPGRRSTLWLAPDLIDFDEGRIE